MFKFTYAFGWFILTPAILVSLVVSGYLYQTQIKTVQIEPSLANAQTHTIQASAGIGGHVRGLSTDIRTGDARPLIIEEFLRKHQSPLYPYDYWGRFLTEIADKYELDFRLLPSIAMQESNLCKRIPENSFNCLGLGVHSRGTWKFERFEDNFDAAGRILRNNYLDQGLHTPEEIQSKYTPGSTGSWEFAVNYFMDILERADF